MKTKILALQFSLLFATNLYSQELSDSAKILREQVKVRNTQAILEAGDSGDKSLIPFLRSLDTKSTAPWAKIALAKLGDDKAIREILTNVDSRDSEVRSPGMDSLVRVGGKIAFRKLYEKLNLLNPLSKPGRRNARTNVDEYDGAYELFLT